MSVCTQRCELCAPLPSLPLCSPSRAQPDPASITFLPVPQGGFGILEEMCVNYVHYYPQTQLELCKSAVDPGYLHRYFSLVNRYRASTQRGWGLKDHCYKNPGV